MEQKVEMIEGIEKFVPECASKVFLLLFYEKSNLKKIEFYVDILGKDHIFLISIFLDHLQKFCPN